MFRSPFFVLLLNGEQSPRPGATSEPTIDPVAEKVSASASAGEKPESSPGDDSSSLNTAPDSGRGRGRTREPPFGSCGKSVTGAYAEGGGGGGGGGGAKVEASAWAVAMSQAVGGLVRPDADACAPKLRFK